MSEELIKKVIELELKEKKKKSKSPTGKKRTDLKFGCDREKVILPILNKHFSYELKSSDDKYSTFDFKDDINKVVVELKSRRLTKRKFPTTMMPYNKVLKGFDYIDKGYKVYFAFYFTNRLCYYELTRAGFNMRWVRYKQTTRRDRGYAEVSDMSYIPIDKLTNICDVV